MLKADKRVAIQRVIDNHTALTEVFRSLDAVVGSTTGSPVFESAWKLFDEYLHLVEERIGDTGQWTGWFIYDNNCGEGALKAGVGRSLRKIKTIDDLLDLIEATK